MPSNKHVRFLHESLNESLPYSPASSWQTPQMQYYELSPASTSSNLSHSPMSPCKKLHSPALGPRMVPLTPSPYDDHMPLPQTPYMNTLSIPPSPSHSPHRLPNKSLAPSMTTTTVAFILAPPLDMRSSPGILWDMILYPNNARCPMSGSFIDANDPRLGEPATYPPLPALTIFSPNLPWEFTITPATGTFVRVGDILHGLSRELRTGLSEKEQLRTPQDIWKKVEHAFKQRYRRDPRYHDQEKQKGPKRVDFLFGQTRWMGLSPSTRDDKWQLNFA